MFPVPIVFVMEFVNVAAAIGLGLYPVLKAAALTVVLLVRVIAPAYSVEVCVGVEPSVV